MTASRAAWDLASAGGTPGLPDGGTALAASLLLVFASPSLTPPLLRNNATSGTSAIRPSSSATRTSSCRQARAPQGSAARQRAAAAAVGTAAGAASPPSAASAAPRRGTLTCSRRSRWGRSQPRSAAVSRRSHPREVATGTSTWTSCASRAGSSTCRETSRSTMTL
eukprot:scaffold7525_cov248-Pinguiococcus_pyrenoidosus.AAC.1